MGQFVNWRISLFFVGGTAVFFMALFLFTASPLSAQAATPMPTPDRLAAPPTVAAPTQADEGAQLFWLHCQPCHGDQGQGLSDAPDDDWRAQYPEEDQYCWNSGCHGERPYEEGFTLPKQVPAVIGDSSLGKFNTATDVYHYIRAAMPFQAPATLSDEEYLAVAVFLAEAHDGLDSASLTAVSDQPPVRSTPEATLSAAAPTSALVPPASTTSNASLWLIGGGLLILFIVGGSLWLKQNQ